MNTKIDAHLLWKYQEVKGLSSLSLDAHSHQTGFHPQELEENAPSLKNSHNESMTEVTWEINPESWCNDGKNGSLGSTWMQVQNHLRPLYTGSCDAQL